jgi:endo-1,4-beta-xylanase
MKMILSHREQYGGKWVVILSLLVMFSIDSLAQIQTNVPALKEVYSRDFYIGCILSYKHVGFPSDSAVTGQSAVVDPNGGHLMKFHMNSMSPGNNMKPQYTVDISGSAAAFAAATSTQVKDSVDTHPIVKFNGDMIAQLNWAKKQGFTFRGHTLVWHSQTPGTSFFRSGYTSGGARLTKEKMTERMENYIKEVVRLIHASWPGLLSAMDVVNEAVNDGGTDRTTDSEWYVTFGDNSYLIKAFELARKYTVQYGETQLKLYYNDYNTHSATKADGIVRILTPIFQAGFLDGIGMQEHDANSSPTAAEWINSYNKFSPICTEMTVTELDVTTGSATPSPAVLATQANQYGMLFKCFVERSYRSGRGKIINVSKDGLNDALTFKTNQSSSIWDGQNQCKPSFYAVANVGINYNALDSLITYADSLKQNVYTPVSWTNFASALISAKNAKVQNYSASVSADTALGKAKNNMKAAIDGLVPTAVVDFVNGNNPKTFTLSQNYPNPFNPTTTIQFTLPQRCDVNLELHNTIGQVVMVLTTGVYSAGSHTIAVDGSALASGVYFYKLQTGSNVALKKLVLLK